MASNRRVDARAIARDIIKTFENLLKEREVIIPSEERTPDDGIFVPEDESNLEDEISCIIEGAISIDDEDYDEEDLDGFEEE